MTGSLLATMSFISDKNEKKVKVKIGRENTDPIRVLYVSSPFT
jgi:hypothetical protein